jgi:protoheme IX farnesyltransferase
MTWRTVFALTRVILSLVVACSALTGFICFRHAITIDAWAAFAGVFLLACAASALNQYQERDFDALMDRTKRRPLPMRQMSGRAALGIALVAGLTGAAVLFFGSTPLAALLGVFTLLWYNGVYTPLKRRTRFAVLIGALAGALPPMIGYTSAGGGIISSCLVISLFMFLWQVSHVQLLLVKYGKEYEKAGFLAMTSMTNEKSARTSVFVWLAAAAGGGMLLLALHVVSGFALSAVLVAGSVLFLLYGYKKIPGLKQTTNFNSLLGSVYLYQGFIFILAIGNVILIPL